MINRYQTFHRSDGHTVKLPPDKWEGQSYARKPGNLYSRPMDVTISTSSATSLVLDQEIPAVEDFAKQEQVREVRADQVRPALEVLGHRHVSRRVGPVAGGIRLASGRAVPARHQPRPLPGGRRQLARDAESQISSPTTPSGSRSPATTAYRRSTATSSTRTGRLRGSRALCSCRYSTRRRTTTTRMP
jgi:hypothetical protein